MYVKTFRLCNKQTFILVVQQSELKGSVVKRSCVICVTKLGGFVHLRAQGVSRVDLSRPLCCHFQTLFWNSEQQVCFLSQGIVANAWDWTLCFEDIFEHLLSRMTFDNVKLLRPLYLCTFISTDTLSRFGLTLQSKFTRCVENSY